jgi:hypothetical protein
MRKVTQVSAQGDRLYAVCDDGTVWLLDTNGVWHETPAIPQPPAETTTTNPAPAST